LSAGVFSGSTGSKKKFTLSVLCVSAVNYYQSLNEISLTLNFACPVKFIEDKERSLTRETYLSFLFNWGEFNWGTLNLER
jgi:hypothetical protein